MQRGYPLEPAFHFAAYGRSGFGTSLAETRTFCTRFQHYLPMWLLALRTTIQRQLSERRDRGYLIGLIAVSQTRDVEMEYFTRQLYDLSQPENNSTPFEAALPRIEALWREAEAEYQRMFASVLPSLPVGARAFFEKVEMHDAKFLSVVTEPNETVTMLFDTTGSWLPGERFQVSFHGVKQVDGLTGLEGEYWLYTEVHPSSSAAFELQVLCWRTEFRIVADDVSSAAIGEKKKKQRH